MVPIDGTLKCNSLCSDRTFKGLVIQIQLLQFTHFGMGILNNLTVPVPIVFNNSCCLTIPYLILLVSVMNTYLENQNAIHLPNYDIGVFSCFLEGNIWPQYKKQINLFIK